MLFVVAGLIEKWQGLEGRLDQLQKMRSLQRKMAELKDEFLEINNRVSSTDHDDLQDHDQLKMKIFKIIVSHLSLIHIHI